jgi:hypothetical protein
MTINVCSLTSILCKIGVLKLALFLMLVKLLLYPLRAKLLVLTFITYRVIISLYVSSVAKIL